ncbi:hypothetical protein [Deinococcus peraridilitoris]|uniref:Uncharacterized protein n=1 Tax=Deinococcus peraridilitoris (strain DSM 19664 / LMG 22246 / CIP 109416 / KR-200) TaxID=937777 RepID=L0A311_DEIPD|nr:hypothetical protein [Deinococcus peraridilitoris]AFZ67567.1 hypothetical protein Deipe_2071 [Deinococcus peraridilitoris DSM 19664]
MPRVRNKQTGLTHQVPEGHFSLTRTDEYEVLQEPTPPPALPKPPRKK